MSNSTQSYNSTYAIFTNSSQMTSNICRFAKHGFYPDQEREFLSICRTHFETDDYAFVVISSKRQGATAVDKGCRVFLSSEEWRQKPNERQQKDGLKERLRDLVEHIKQKFDTAGEIGEHSTLSDINALLDRQDEGGETADQ